MKVISELILDGEIIETNSHNTLYDGQPCIVIKYHV